VKFIDEYRNEADAQRLVQAIQRVVTRPWTLMEICGGQTHTLIKSGIDRLLPREVTLVHGPGCPVCVTPLEMIDRALAIAHQPGVILTSFGDMLRVPGSSADLLSARAQGADVRIVYSPLDALKLAQQNPDRQVVFLRGWLRDDCAGQCGCGLAGKPAWSNEFLDPQRTCAGAAGNGGDFGRTGSSGSGLFGGRPCLRGDGLLGI
jgi:hypothetical protein